jgi:hypothetical protein
MGLDLQGTPDPCTNGSGISQEGMPGHSNKLRAPPSKVRVLARSRDKEDPSMGKGPMPARVEAMPYTSRSGGGSLLPRGVWPVT